MCPVSSSREPKNRVRAWLRANGRATARIARMCWGGSGDDSFLRHSPQARYRHARMLESIQHVSPFTRPGAVAFDSCPDVPGRQPATGSAALLVNAQFGAHGVDLGLHGQVLLLLARQVVAREV